MSYWEIAARLAEESGAEVNWDEEYFICPHCEEPVFPTKRRGCTYCSFYIRVPPPSR